MKPNQLFNSIAAASLLLATSGQTHANHYYDYARVLDADPVYEWVNVSRPQRECYRVSRTQQNPAPTIIGAVVGGVIGNAIGHKRHTRRFTTVAGAALGGAIGHDIGQRNAHTQVSRHCEVAYHEVERVRELQGYDVTYRYKGETLHAFTRNHPGKRLKVRVNVQAAY